MTAPDLDADGRLSPATLAWLSSVRRFAVDVAAAGGRPGRDHTSGRVVVEPNPGDLATACWNGDLRFDTRLAATLDDVFARPGATYGPEALAERRRACFVALHEFLHLQTGEFQEWFVSEHRYSDGRTPAYRALEEGVTDVVTARSFRPMVTRTGLEVVAPGIVPVADGAMPYGYQRYAHAAAALVQRVADSVGSDADELLLRLNAQNAPGKWETLASHLVAGTPGADEVFRIASRRSSACATVARAMTSAYARIGDETGPATTATDRADADAIVVDTLGSGLRAASTAVERTRAADRPRWQSVRARAAVRLHGRQP